MLIRFYTWGHCSGTIYVLNTNFFEVCGNKVNFKSRVNAIHSNNHSQDAQERANSYFDEFGKPIYAKSHETRYENSE